jgi:hypothetical protein
LLVLALARLLYPVSFFFGSVQVSNLTWKGYRATHTVEL